jgi:ketosteroid isomerase-like protein
MTEAQDGQSLVVAFLAATNAFDTDAAVALFARDAVIDDPSTGERFAGQRGVRDYVERFFVGYHTVSRLLSVEPLGHGRSRARVDFTGDFGHEVGRLDLVVDDDGRITRIDADLE